MSVSGEQAEPAELDRLRARVTELECALADQRQATAKAERERLFWQRVVEAAPEFISVFDADFRYVYVNYGAPDYGNVEMCGQNLFQFIAPECAATARAAIQEALTTGQPTQYEACDVKMRYWYSNHVRKLDLNDGQSYVVIVTHSIDARRRTELELRNARELWDSLVTNSPDTILLMDREAKIHFINRVAPGYTPEHVVGAHGQDFALPKYREPMLAAIRAAIDTATPQYFEMQDQVNAMWWAVTLVPVRNEHRVDLVLAISSDVTERRRAEESLRESEARLRMLLAQVPALLWTIDNDQRILSIDGVGLQTLGLTTVDWQGKTLAELFRVTDPTFVALVAHRAALLGKSVTYEQLLADSDYQMHVEPLRDHAGNIVGALGVGIDVTSRKASEEEVRRANDELEHRVAARTFELDRVNKSLREDIDKRELVERALRESEERFRIIAETVPVAVIITRQSDGLIMFANRRTGELVDIPHPQLLGRHSSEFYADPSERAEVVAQLQAGTGMVERVLRLKRQDNQDVYVNVSYQPIVFAGEPAILT
ncbi:MAG TPA: PAS domain S-box protein, partial [Pirellulaceae bacterium]|nr:PAS domain S-box protein [Pirellulaceae bacterium]